MRLESQPPIREVNPKILIPLVVAFVFCCFAPFATRALISALAPEGLCSPLIPKLQPGLGKFDTPKICEANAFFGPASSSSSVHTLSRSPPPTC